MNQAVSIGSRPAFNGLVRQSVSYSLSSRVFIIGFLLLHIPMALLLKDVKILSTVHALVVLGVGLVLALSNAPTRWVVYTLGYIVGSEILWRMTKSIILWELGKYAVILVIAITFWRIRNFRIPQLPLIYLLMLAPSSVMVLVELGFSAAREELSFNLSGPTALLACACFFSNVRLNQKQLQYLLIAIIAPTIGIATIAVQGIITNPNIQWIGDSNPASSGGFGPNQVSTALGLGLLAAWLILFTIKNPVIPRVFFVAIALWLATQTLLTFSRGGMLAALLGIVGSLCVALINRRIRLRMLLYAGIGFVIFMIAVYPQIDAMTGGALSLRYSGISVENSSGRDKLVELEFQVFLDNPIWGVGPGQAKKLLRSANHTEYSRLLADHGIFGILSLASLMLMGLLTYLREQGRPVAQMVIIASVLWTLFYMTNASMRTVAPSFMFGLIFAQFYLDKNAKLHPHNSIRQAASQPML